MIRPWIAGAMCLFALSEGEGAGVSRWTWADDPYQGTWIVQPELTSFGLRSPVLSLDHGIFRRSDCHEAIELPTDGNDHDVRGHPFFDAMSARKIDPQRLEVVGKRAGKSIWKGLYIVSRDSQTMTLEFEDSRAATPVTGKIVYSRAGDPVAGEFDLSATWTPQKLAELSPSGLDVSITTQRASTELPSDRGPDSEERFVLIQGDGRNAAGEFDSHDHPLAGYLQGATLSINRAAPDTLRINRSQGGRLVEVSILTVADDGTTMRLSQIDWDCQSETSYVLNKQRNP